MYKLSVFDNLIIQKGKKKISIAVAIARENFDLQLLAQEYCFCKFVRAAVFLRDHEANINVP